MQHSAPTRLRLRRACTAAALLLVLLPLLSALTIGLLGLDPMQGLVAVAQALGAGGDGAGMDGGGMNGMFARAVAAAARWMAEWWFVLMLLASLAGSLLMAGVALTERSLALPLRIGWGLLFLGLFISLSPYLAAAAMLLFAWLFLRRPRVSDAQSAGGPAAAADGPVPADGQGD